MNKKVELQEFIYFLRQELGEYKLSINEDTEVAVDLGVAGDDGDDLVTAIAKKYQVDVSRFDVGKYFGSEPTFFGPYNESLESLTVGSLIGQIERGYLV